MFGWWYMLLIVLCLGFVLWLVFLLYGCICLGYNEELLVFGYVVWVLMLFLVGIGIVLLYYGVYELLDYFLYLFG